MKQLPTLEEIVHLHKKYAPSEAAYELVFTHCQIVAELAKNILEASPRHDIDPVFVEAACLLHDIGVYRLYASSGEIDHEKYIQHGVLGYEILKAEGFDERLCRIASHHTGVGLSREDVISQKLPLPPADYMAETPEERLVLYADKFHTKSTPPKLMNASTYREFTRKFGVENVVRFDALIQEFGEPDLQSLAYKYSLEIA